NRASSTCHSTSRGTAECDGDPPIFKSGKPSDPPVAQLAHDRFWHSLAVQRCPLLGRLVGLKRKCCERHQFDAPDPTRIWGLQIVACELSIRINLEIYSRNVVWNFLSPSSRARLGRAVNRGASRCSRSRTGSKKSACLRTNNVFLQTNTLFWFPP